MIEEWIRSETNCLNSAAKALSWLQPFFDTQSSFFRVSYQQGDLHSQTPSPTATTSIIGNLTAECMDPKIIPSELSNWAELEQQVTKATQSIYKAPEETALPLRTFGFLPLFSVTYLCQFLAETPNPLSLKSYAIALRRVLYAIYASRSSPMHPFLLLNCVKSILELRRIVESVTDDDALKQLSISLRNENVVETLLKAIEPNKKLYDLKDVYGIDDLDFLRHSINPFSSGRVNIVMHLDRELKALESMAYHAAIDQLAKYDGKANLRLDPSALTFSLEILSHLSYPRLPSLINRGMRAVFDCCVNGFFASALPFHIDNKGRALFVPSVEIVHTALSTALRHFDALPQTDLDFLIKSTKQMEEILSAEYNQIEIAGNKGPIPVSGWCLDRAPSVNRVDAWITMHVLVFFISIPRIPVSLLAG